MLSLEYTCSTGFANTVMENEEWNAGRLVCDYNTKVAKIVDAINIEKTKIDKIEQIKARIRMNG